MNHTYTIRGGAPVKGEITCLGAKNFATKAMVAACLGDSTSTLTNVPRIGDVEITIDLIRSIGGGVEWSDETTLKISPASISTHVMQVPDSRLNRIPILFLPVLLHRFGNAEVPRLGGCNIGKRNTDFHTEAARLFGAEVEEDAKGTKAHTRKRLTATHYKLPYPSVGATESCLFLAVKAKGTSVISNAAIEPEIMELITMLRAMGAIIFLGTNREIRIEGVENLHGTHMHVLGDRIEAGSWASLACASGGDITVRGVRPESLGNFLSTYRQVGGGYEFLAPEVIRFFREGALKPTTLETDVYPGFSTDWQQPFAVLLTQAEGMSVIHETVYESRFGYTDVLNNLGAKIQLSTQCLGNRCRFADHGHAHSALIMGKTPLTAPPHALEVPDLRAGLAYFIAAAIAKGSTTLTAIERIERGYGDLSTRLSQLSIDMIKAPTVVPLVPPAKQAV